jgi:ammonia channel protein AmtB
MAISSMWLFWGAILTLGGYYGTTLTSSSSTNTKDLTQGVWLTSKLVDISLNFLVFIALGWALSFGKDDGLMFAGSSQFFINGVSEEAGGMSLVFFTFALTNLPVVVVTEQIRLYTAPLNAPYHLATLCFGTCAFPVLLHSLWADDGWASAYRSTDKRALLLVREYVGVMCCCSELWL